MRTASQILGELGIRYRPGLAAWSAVCPKCSHLRTKRRAQCLSVSIDQVGAKWNCHHCGWHGGQFFDAIGGTNGVVAAPQQRSASDNANGRRALESGMRASRCSAAPARRTCDRARSPNCLRA